MQNIVIDFTWYKPIQCVRHKKTECRLTHNDTHQNVGENWKQTLCWGVVAVLMLYGVIEKVTQNSMWSSLLQDQDCHTHDLYKHVAFYNAPPP